VALDDVEPRLGTLHDWRDLVDAAHARGLRLILDFVANHVSDQHPAFVAARADRSSPFVPWFRFRQWPDVYQGFFDLPSMPVLETNNADVRAHLIDQAKLWLSRGCDGFRLDHAHGPGPGFWSEFRAAIKTEYPDAILLGEVTEPPAEQRVYAGRMDGLLDFTLAEVFRQTFRAPPGLPDGLGVFLNKHLAYFGDELLLASFLDSHDMNRFLWLVGNDARKLRLAALCQFTLPVPPIVYYGTEVGLSQRAPTSRLEHARLPMPLETERDLKLVEFYRALIALRRAGGAVWRQGPTFEFDARPSELIAYRSGPYRVVLNPSEDTVETRLNGELVFQTKANAVVRGREFDLLAPWSGVVVLEQ
jgi:glycosidase